jgi:hypothetical protein
LSKTAYNTSDIGYQQPEPKKSPVHRSKISAIEEVKSSVPAKVSPKVPNAKVENNLIS